MYGDFQREGTVGLLVRVMYANWPLGCIITYLREHSTEKLTGST